MASAETNSVEPTMNSIERFCRQYLQLERDVDFPDSSLLRRDEIQSMLFQRLFADGALKHPPPPRYQSRILKALIPKIEDSIDDWDEHGVSDDLMNAFSELVANPLPSETDAAQQKSFVTYSLSLLRDGDRTPEITILESPNLLAAAGTTGLRTWEASLHLGQYLCATPDLVRGAAVLEMGAGTGYVSIMCSKFLGATSVIASDGSDDVVANLPENLYLNELEGSNLITVMDLKWGHALMGTEEEIWNGGRNLDLVLGADVTYDNSVLPALVGTMDDLFELYPAVQILISATERNRETLDSFLGICQKRRFTVFELDFPIPSRAEQLGPFYNDHVPIRICKITRPV